MYNSQGGVILSVTSFLGGCSFLRDVIYECSLTRSLQALSWSEIMSKVASPLSYPIIFQTPKSLQKLPKWRQIATSGHTEWNLCLTRSLQASSWSEIMSKVASHNFWTSAFRSCIKSIWKVKQTWNVTTVIRRGSNFSVFPAFYCSYLELINPIQFNYSFKMVIRFVIGFFNQI